ncbi:MAG: nitrilase-related carbon-nitrogen hydrolase [Candidatus Methanomethylophilaceae archaeon]|jgi:predicted amidohydrolase
MKDTRVAIVQMENSPGMLSDNLSKMKGYMSGASKMGVDIICFPEGCLTGYTSSDPMSIKRDDPSVKEILALSSEEHMAVIFGFIEKDGSDTFVTQVEALPSGGVMYYRKTHLGVRERKCFTEGDIIDTIASEKAVIGLQLCWEAHMPEVSTTLRNKGAEIIFMPHSMKGPADRRRSVWMKYIPARAYDNGVYVCACNSMKGEGTGGIMIVDRHGDVIAEDFSGKETMMIKDLPALPKEDVYPDDMKEANYFLRRRPGIYDLH